MAMDHIDIKQLKAEFHAQGVVQMRGFLGNKRAKAIRDAMASSDDWLRVFNSEQGVHNVKRADYQALSDEERQALDAMAYRNARYGFQYRYETIRIPDNGEFPEHIPQPLGDFVRHMRSDDMLRVLGEITGNGKINFADGQATAYAPGDFLTGHDDDVAGKNRHAAYVYSLNPDWRAEWGGLLLIQDEKWQHIERALIPVFDCLTLFKIPKNHMVTEVTRATPYRRYSITGWLRTL